MKEPDFYRDSLYRYMGYANEVGEIFRPLWKRQYVQLMYLVSVAYISAETAEKCSRAARSPFATPTSVAVQACDVLLWQSFASVIIPGYTINRIMEGTRLIMHVLKVPNIKYSPICVGLLSIPFIIRPIDHLVDYVMDNTYRKYK